MTTSLHRRIGLGIALIGAVLAGPAAACQAPLSMYLGQPEVRACVEAAVRDLPDGARDARANAARTCVAAWLAANPPPPPVPGTPIPRC